MAIKIQKSIVFSTYVEVIPDGKLEQKITFGILHVCGGDPSSPFFNLISHVYSPRMWRWSFFSIFANSLSLVFSTYVEVILWWKKAPYIFNGILHVCGGDPITSENNLPQFEYSPRMWRWSSASGVGVHKMLVFSTYVEVILPKLPLIFQWVCILHVCGGDPSLYRAYMESKKYSPRMWRWSRP